MNAVSSSQGFTESERVHYPPAANDGDDCSCCCCCCVNTVDLPAGLLVDIRQGLRPSIPALHLSGVKGMQQDTSSSEGSGQSSFFVDFSEDSDVQDVKTAAPLGSKQGPSAQIACPQPSTWHGNKAHHLNTLCLHG